MINQFEKYYTFFQQGYLALEKERERVQELKQKIEAQKVEKNLIPVTKGVWCPDSIGGNRVYFFLALPFCKTAFILLNF